MFAIGQPLKVLLFDFSLESPLGGQLAVPLASNPLSFRVVVVLGVGKLLLMVCLRLAGGERFRDGQHGYSSKYRVCPGLGSRSCSGFSCDSSLFGASVRGFAIPLLATKSAGCAGIEFCSGQDGA